MEQDAVSNEATGALPWGFVLEPAPNLVALREVQQRGLNAARHLADRVVSSIEDRDRFQTLLPSPAPTPENPGDFPVLRDLVQIGWKLTSQILTAFVIDREVEQQDRSYSRKGRVTVELDDPTPQQAWQIDVDSVGRPVAASELWLHNSSPSPMGPVLLQLGVFTGGHENELPVHCVSVQPAEIAELPPKSARGVTLTLSTTDRFDPGVYCGQLYAGELLIAVEITVHGPQ